MGIASEQRFSNRVADYVRYRPGYPDEMLRAMKLELGLGQDSTVADIGSGTGISSAFLLRSGCEVFGVEPNREMRTAAEALLKTERRFTSVDGSAARTTLPNQSMDAVVAAQAFHWFNTAETRAEFSRILKPGGKVALIWNERQVDSTPFLRDYESLLLQYGTDYAAIRHENVDVAALAAFFDGPVSSHVFGNEQSFDFEGLKGRLLSCSYAPVSGDPLHEPMLAELRRVYDLHECDGRVSFLYDTRLYIGG